MSDIINSISQFISEKAETVTRKTDEILAVQGLKGQIRTTKREIDKHYYELGKAVFAEFEKGAELGKEDKAHCEEVVRLNKLVEQYKADIEAYKTRGDEFSNIWDDEDSYDDIVEEVEAEVVEEAEVEE